MNNGGINKELSRIMEREHGLDDRKVKDKFKFAILKNVNTLGLNEEQSKRVVELFINLHESDLKDILKKLQIIDTISGETEDWHRGIRRAINMFQYLTIDK